MLWLLTHALNQTFQKLFLVCNGTGENLNKLQRQKCYNPGGYIKERFSKISFVSLEMNLLTLF